MRAEPKSIPARFVPFGWHADVLARLDERHLVAWSDTARLRTTFSAGLAQFLSSQPSISLCVLHGRSVTSLDALCQQIERQIPGPPLDRRLGGSRGLISLLRGQRPTPGRARPTHRLVLWNDADVLLSLDPPLFGEVVDAIAGVSAELEYASDDALLLQRAAYIGGRALVDYAHDEFGQFRAWRTPNDDEAFWSVVTGIERPPTTILEIDSIL